MPDINNNAAVALSAFGAVSDAKLAAAVTATANSTTLTSTTDLFDAADVGKRIVIAGAGANGGTLRTTIASVQGARSATLSAAAGTSTAGKGAMLGTDAGPALQAALAAVTGTAGGTVVVDGLFLLATPAVKPATYVNAGIRLIGTGGNSGFLIAVGAGQDAITAANCGKLVIEDLNFAGSVGERNDMRRVFSLSGSFVRFVNCGFWGLANNSEPAAVIFADQCDVSMSDNVFGGCAVSSGYNSSAVDCTNVIGFSAERNRQIDYGTFRNVYLSKTGLSFCLAWMHLREQFNTDANAVGQSVLRFVDNRYDEGHVYALKIDCNPTSGKRFDRVFIDGMQVNNTLISDGSAIAISQCNDVEIVRTEIGWANAPHYGMRFVDCGTVVVDRVKVTAGKPDTPTTGLADGLAAQDVDRLILRDAAALNRLNLTNVTEVIRCEAQRGGVLPFSKSGRVTDADFDAPVPLDTIAYDRAGKRLYVRDATGWLATPVLAANADPVEVLYNAAPATGAVSNGLTFRKTSGATAWQTATARLLRSLSGSVKIRVQFVDVDAGDSVTCGIEPASVPEGYATLPGDYYANVTLSTGKIYLQQGNGIVAGPFTYAGEAVELDVSSGHLKLTIGTTVVFDGPQSTAIPAGASYRFSGTCYNVGSGFQLLEFSPL